MKKKTTTGLFAVTKPNLNKTTISNLSRAEMDQKIGGNKTNGNCCTMRNCGCTSEFSSRVH